MPFHIIPMTLMNMYYLNATNLDTISTYHIYLIINGNSDVIGDIMFPDIKYVIHLISN